MFLHRVCIVYVISFQMMKEWAEARERVQELKSFDPKGAEKLNKEVTAVSSKKTRKQPSLKIKIGTTRQVRTRLFFWQLMIARTKRNFSLETQKSGTENVVST